MSKWKRRTQAPLTGLTGYDYEGADPAQDREIQVRVLRAAAAVFEHEEYPISNSRAKSVAASCRNLMRMIEANEITLQVDETPA